MKGKKKGKGKGKEKGKQKGKEKKGEICLHVTYIYINMYRRSAENDLMDKLVALTMVPI